MDTATQSSPGAIDSSLRQKFVEILGTEHVRLTAAADIVSSVKPQLILEPANESQLAAALRLANDSRLAVIPRGGGTKLGWGNPPARSDAILSTARLNRVLEHAWADLTVTVEAGCTMQTLQETLAQRGQRLALDPLWPEKATVGGILSTNDSGALRLRFGALRDLIIGITVTLPDGTLASSGGKVVKNVAGYDLPKLITGAFGTLGVITRAVFRLHPLPHFARTFTCVASGFLPEAQRLLLAIQNSKLAHAALQIRLFEDSPQPKIDILLEGTEAGIDDQVEKLKSLVAPLSVGETEPSVWNAREELFSSATQEEMPCAVAKISMLPSSIESVIGNFCTIAITRVQFSAVVQATGIGYVLLQGEPGEIASILKVFRVRVEHAGGSLTLLNRPAKLQNLDAWGTPGDSLPLMKSVKLQLDPVNTLNPGRFLCGI